MIESSNHLNFSLKIIHCYYDWGIKLPNKTWSGIIGKIASRVNISTLWIFEWSTDLNGWSFEIGSLSNLKKPTLLYLDKNPKFKYLDENIFQPFFESNVGNKILF